VDVSEAEDLQLTLATRPLLIAVARVARDAVASASGGAPTVG
jgi:hypothetical protein